MKIIRAPRGDARMVVDLTDVEIPDLWNIAERVTAVPGLGKKAQEAILETWYLANDLKWNLEHPERRPNNWCRGWETPPDRRETMERNIATIDQISREDFAFYVEVQRSGVVNMWSPQVQALAGITRAVHVGIIKHYKALAAKWPDVVKEV